MEITPNEIDIIEDAGILDGSPVKMIRTKGGFWICVGKPKGKYREEAIGAGSHPAIVKYNVEKQYPNFQPAMMKSEHFNADAVVQKHSHFLDGELRKSGHDIYSIQNGNNIQFHITKHQLRIASPSCVLDKNNTLTITVDFPKQFSRAFSAAALEKAASCGAERIAIRRKNAR
jgi:hypothetical protein